jgi:cytochrome c556
MQDRLLPNCFQVAATMLVSQFNDAFHNVLQTCKSCHQQFRAD